MYHHLSKIKLIILVSFFSVFIIAVSLYLFFHRKQNINNNSDIIISENIDYQNELLSDKNGIFVDISGQIVNPGVYEMEEGTRVLDLMNIAGGLTQEADQDYISKQLNQAALLSDGQKIYIPKKGENLSENGGSISSFRNNKEKVSINYSSATELDSLPGIGEKRASSIINNRPYGSIEELLLRKIIPQSVFEDIKNDISL